MTRRSRAEQIAALKEAEEQKRRRRLQLEAKEKLDQRKLDTRRKIVTGAAVLAHADLHPEFAAALRSALDKAVTKPADRELLADLLRPGSAPKDTSSEPPAAQSDTTAPSEQSKPHQG
jgi:hypothetical protein